MKTLIASLMLTSAAVAAPTSSDPAFDFQSFSEFIVANSQCTDFVVNVIGIATERNVLGAKLHWPMEKTLEQGGLYEQRAKDSARADKDKFCEDARQKLGAYDPDELRARGIIR